MEPNTPSPEVMWSISRIADRDKVSKATVSEHVKRLVSRNGLIVTRDQRGRVSLVNVVQYDDLRARYSDPSKSQAPHTDMPEVAHVMPILSGPAKNSYEEAVRQRAWHEVEKRRLEVLELSGQLVRVDKLREGISNVGREIIKIVDKLPQEAENLCIQTKSSDVHAARIYLKKSAHRMRTEIADALMDLANSSPDFDDSPDNLYVDEV